MHILNLNPLEPLLSVSSVYVQASPLHHRIFLMECNQVSVKNEYYFRIGVPAYKQALTSRSGH